MLRVGAAAAISSAITAAYSSWRKARNLAIRQESIITATREELEQAKRDLDEVKRRLRAHEMSVRARASPDDRDGPMPVVATGHLPCPISLFDECTPKPATITFSDRFTSRSRSSRVPRPAGREEYSASRSQSSLDSLSTLSTQRHPSSTSLSPHLSEQHSDTSTLRIFEGAPEDATGVLSLRSPQGAVQHAGAQHLPAASDHVCTDAVEHKRTRPFAQLTAWAERIDNRVNVDMRICVGIIVMLLIIIAVLLQHIVALQQELVKQETLRMPPSDVCEVLRDRGASALRRFSMASSTSLSALLFIGEATAKHLRLLVDCSGGSALAPAPDYCAILLGGGKMEQVQGRKSDAMGEHESSPAPAVLRRRHRFFRLLIVDLLFDLLFKKRLCLWPGRSAPALSSA